MRIDLRRILTASAVSIVLLGLIAAKAQFRLPDLSKADPFWIFGLLGAHLVMVMGRGLSLRSLADAGSDRPTRAWIRLAARHQAMFSLFPTGLGDLSFPVLAGRMVKVEPSEALRILAQFRLRDVVMLALIGLTGLAAVGTSLELGPLVIVAMVGALFFVDEIAAFGVRILAAIVPHPQISHWLSVAAQLRRATLTERALRTGLAAVVWSASVAAILAASRAAGSPFGLGEALLMVAALNAVGVIAISIGGLGVSEAGAAAALVLSGRTVGAAASIALLVRPLLLLSVLLASLLIEVTLSILGSPDSSIK